MLTFFVVTRLGNDGRIEYLCQIEDSCWKWVRVFSGKCLIGDSLESGAERHTSAEELADEHGGFVEEVLVGIRV